MGRSIHQTCSEAEIAPKHVQEEASTGVHCLEIDQQVLVQAVEENLEGCHRYHLEGVHLAHDCAKTHQDRACAELGDKERGEVEGDGVVPEREVTPAEVLPEGQAHVVDLDGECTHDEVLADSGSTVFAQEAVKKAEAYEYH